LKKRIQDILSWATSLYDKVIALLVLVILLGSLLYLAVRIGMEHTTQKRFAEDIGRMSPRHPEAADIDTADFQASLDEIGRPFRIAAWTNAMFVPEARVWCTDCRRPIPYHAETCPFCGEVQEEDPDKDPRYDGDRDGMWDRWERDYGLDPFEPGDADLDKDGDGFTNLEEFMGDPKTDPTDPKAFPPIVVKLRVTDIKEDPFLLRFKGMITLPDRSLKFQINLRGDRRTYFRKLGETVEGFKLLDFEEKYEERQVAGRLKKVDVSVLTLQHGTKKIPLIKDKDVEFQEFIAYLQFLLDGKSYAVKEKDVLNLRGREYEVIDVDSVRERVVIRGLHNNRESVIERLPGNGGGEAHFPDSEPAAVGRGR